MVPKLFIFISPLDIWIPNLLSYWETLHSTKAQLQSPSNLFCSQNNCNSTFEEGVGECQQLKLCAKFIALLSFYNVMNLMK